MGLGGCYKMEKKRCPRCGITKPMSEYSKNADRKDGLQSFCKACASEMYYHSIGKTVMPFKPRPIRSIEPLTERKCSQCKVVKPISEFYKNAANPSGFSYQCKTCTKTASKERYRQTHIPIGHKKGIDSPRGKQRFLAKDIHKHSRGDTCITLHIHSEIMKDDPEHLTTEFMQKILGRKC